MCKTISVNWAIVEIGQKWHGRRHRLQHRERMCISGEVAHLACLARGNLPCPWPVRWALARAAGSAVSDCASTLVWRCLFSGAALSQRFAHRPWRDRWRSLLMRWAHENACARMHDPTKSLAEEKNGSACRSGPPDMELGPLSTTRGGGVPYLLVWSTGHACAGI